MNNLYILSIFCFSVLFSISNDEILDLMQLKNNWIFYDNKDNINISILDNQDIPIIKLEKNIDFSFNEVVEVISDISNYSKTFEGNNIYTEFMYQELDTLYGYQKIKNIIPFTRNRHFIFQLFKVNDSRLSWKIIEKDNDRYDKYRHKKNKELRLGSGSWQFYENNQEVKLIYYFYLDPEFNMPKIFINGARIKNVLIAFKNVLDVIDKNNIIME